MYAAARVHQLKRHIKQYGAEGASWYVTCPTQNAPLGPSVNTSLTDWLRRQWTFRSRYRGDGRILPDRLGFWLGRRNEHRRPFNRKNLTARTSPPFADIDNAGLIVGATSWTGQIQNLVFRGHLTPQ